MRYTVCWLADETFVCIVETDDGADATGLTSLAEFERFASVTAPPHAHPAARIAGYQPRRSADA